MRTIVLLSLVLAFGEIPALLAAQRYHSSNQTRTFHIRGTVSDSLGDVFPSAEVVFSGQEITRKILTDEHGSYDVELPSGLYTMSAQPSTTAGYDAYRRPTFQVGSSEQININVTLYPVRMTCDVVIVPGKPGPEEEREAEKGACGGEDLFDIPSHSGPNFPLYIRFLRRIFAGRKLEYSGDIVANPDIYAPVRVEYNLVTLEAKHVIYDPEQQTIEAKGAVVMTDESGKMRKSDQMALRFSNGQLITEMPSFRDHQ